MKGQPQRKRQMIQLKYRQRLTHGLDGLSKDTLWTACWKKLLVDLSIDGSLPAEEAGTILVQDVFFLPGFPHGTEEGKAGL